MALNPTIKTWKSALFWWYGILPSLLFINSLFLTWKTKEARCSLLAFLALSHSMCMISPLSGHNNRPHISLKYLKTNTLFVDIFKVLLSTANHYSHCFNILTIVIGIPIFFPAWLNYINVQCDQPSLSWLLYFKWGWFQANAL